MSNNEHLKSATLKAGIGSAIVLILTSIHHIYGAIVYNTPWRFHVVHPAALTTLIIAALLFLSYKRSRTIVGQIAFYLAISIILIVPVSFFGIFEGGYNHVLKNVFYFSGAGEPLMQKLFPPPTYELPNDLFFEITGILTFVAGVAAAYFAYRLLSIWREIRQDVAVVTP
jgi:hypothetical protein